MRVRISHETVYRYERPAKALVQALRLTPRDHDGQHVLDWRIEPSDDARLRPREDGFGNLVHMLSLRGSLDEFRIRVSGEVETQDYGGVVRGAVERAPAGYYLRDSELTEADAAIRGFAAEAAGDLGDPIAALHRLLASLNQAVAFDTAPTSVTTKAAEAFALRRGVCQDITHIFIAAARSLGIPARYLSGYFVRADGVVDQEAGHAWAEARVPDLGWVGFDVMNGICTGEPHVRVAIGLDYLGAAPVRGSRTGGGSEHMTVALRIESAQEQRQGQFQGQSQGQAQGQGQGQS